MIILGIVLVLLAYWLLPELAPTFPPNIESVLGGVGVILIILGVVLWVLGASGRSVGGRRYWY